jgi:hypothetical protein
MSPKVNEAAKIAQIHYIYQQRPNKERADNLAKRKLTIFRQKKEDTRHNETIRRR